MNIPQELIDEHGAKFFVDAPERHWYPSQGWALFEIDTGVFEPQRIDALQEITGMDDGDADAKARAMGYLFEHPAFPYRVTGYPGQKEEK